MIQEIGKRVREGRERLGIGLNELAKKLDVSPGYLHNLECGKTNKISLDVLEKIQNELHVLPLETTTLFTQRMNRIEQQLNELEKKDPLYVEFLLHNIESNIKWFTQHILK